MGIFTRFEKKVEGAVNGVFARAFKGDVQPVEITARLQRELDTEAKLMSRDVRLVPNEFVVKLSDHDHDKLAPYGRTLTRELAGDLKTHAAAMGYVFNGPVSIHLELDSSLPTGRFTVSSEAVAGDPTGSWAAPARPPQTHPRRHPRDGTAVGSAPARTPQPRPVAAPDATSLMPPAVAESAAARSSALRAAQLVLEVNGVRHPLQPPGLVIGRGSEADLRINDPGISRRHAEVRVHGTGADLEVEIVDLGSTNGILVNGRRVRQSALQSGSRIEIGSTRMLVHAPAGS